MHLDVETSVQRTNAKKAAKMSPVDMNGYWKMTSNENFDEYMEALGRIILHFLFIYSLYPCEISFAARGI